MIYLLVPIFGTARLRSSLEGGKARSCFAPLDDRKALTGTAPAIKIPRSRRHYRHDNASDSERGQPYNGQPHRRHAAWPYRVADKPSDARIQAQRN